MNSHELARILLAAPDLPVAVHANNHSYMSGIDERSHGPLKVAILRTHGGTHIQIGNMWKQLENAPNWYITAMVHGDIEFKQQEFWRNSERCFTDYVYP